VYRELCNVYDVMCMVYREWCKVYSVKGMV
jgi:hypothetical protein